MVRVVVAVLGALGISGLAAGQSAPPGIRTWPEQAGWVTIFAPIAGTNICASHSKKSGPGSVPLTSFSFSFTRRSAHFYVNYTGQEVPIGQNLTLSIDGSPVLTLPVLSHERIPRAGYQIMANLPGEESTKLLGALERGDRLQIDAGPRRFTVGITGFPAVLRQLGECFTVARLMD